MGLAASWALLPPAGAMVRMEGSEFMMVSSRPWSVAWRK